MPNLYEGAAYSRTPVAERHAGDRTLSHGALSKPLFGSLPLARWIPMDVHSILDYSNGGIAATGAVLAKDPRARAACVFLAASVTGLSLLTDYRLSVAKVVPIEVHEASDHVWGLSAIALPFVLGYWKTEPKIAMSHVVAGVGTILASLVTDYRSWKRRR